MLLFVTTTVTSSFTLNIFIVYRFEIKNKYIYKI